MSFIFMLSCATTAIPLLQNSAIHLLLSVMVHCKRGKAELRARLVYARLAYDLLSLTRLLIQGLAEKKPS
jgi:hypothetical protein